MSVQLAPAPVFQGIGFGGIPLIGGKLNTYIAGTSTPQATYVDSTQTTPNANPVILNANGQANVWLVVGQTYKLVLNDALGNLVWSVDQIPGGQVLTQQSIGQILFPRTPAEVTAGITPTFYNFATEPWYDIKRYGATLANTSAQNLTALNNAISVAQNSSGAAALNGVVILIPGDCHYGYSSTNVATEPQINSGSVPITVLDFAQGDTFDNFPTSYDGSQLRTWFYTPQTSSFGHHNGNGFLINGIWHPYYQVSNNVSTNLVPTTVATDNIRASFLTSWQQATGWRIGQGTLAGTGFTPAQLLNFTVSQGPAAQATINFSGALGAAATSATFAGAATLYTNASGNWLGYTSPVLAQFSDGQIRTITTTNGSNAITFAALTGSGQTSLTLASQQLNSLIVDYLTLNWIVGASSNDALQANYRFKAPVDKLLTFMIESLSDPCTLVLRDQTGSANDVYIKNNAGALALNIPSAGDALVIAQANRNATFSTGLSCFAQSPPAQVTGWGTPVGNAAINNYNITDAGGANSNTNKALAQVIATLKAFGLFGT